MWAFAEEQQLPKIVFINKMDRERADFSKVVEEVSQDFGINPTPVFFPIGAEEDFSGVVDLIKMKAYIYSKDADGKFETVEIPGDIVDIASEWREKMLENIVEVNDELMEKYLEGEELSPQQIEDTLMQGIKSGMIVPILCGSAVLNIGIPQLMDLIIQGFPSPLESASKQGTKPDGDEEVERPATVEAPFSALVFKTVADPFAGKLTLLRVFSGVVQSDSTVYNANKGAKEKFGQLLVMEGKKQQPVEMAGPGDIIAIAKLKETSTGDTLCVENDPVMYKPAEPLPPVISYAIEAKVKGSEDKVFSSLVKLLEEDPTLRLERDQTTSEIILSGTGQIHLEASCEKLNRKFGVEVNLNPVKVPYRETVKKAVKQVIYRHKKQSGGR